jgi:hypothetical protein
MQENQWHPGITIHRLPVGGGIAGFIFAAGTLLICLIGVPAFRSFLAISICAGIAIAVALHLLRKNKTTAPLSLK